MNERYEALFTPWKIGNVEIKNRIVLCPMGGTSLFGWMEPNHFDKEAANFFLERAKNNVGLIIPGAADAFSIFLARNFISGIPDPLIEAARIDGAGERKIFFNIVLPSVKPLIAVITINKMVSSWNAFQWPLLVVNSDELRTIPIAIANLSSRFYDSYDLKMAAATMAIIPVLILYIAFQKHFVEGVTLSGIK